MIIGLTSARFKLQKLLGLLCLCALASACSFSPKKPDHAAVATAHPLATQAAFRALDKGGNAFDAAIAAAAMLAVVEPYGSGLGGGGFWLLQKYTGEAVFIDAREKAPLAAHRDMYLDANGNPLENKPSVNGALAAGIPGQVAAFGHIARHYGVMPLAKSMADAIQVANDGFRVTNKYRKMAAFRQNELKKHDASASIFLNNGELPERGSYLKQPQLAQTLNRIARYGSKDFYRGKIASKLVNDAREAGGNWTLEDFEKYQIVEREPIAFSYNDFDIITAPPPSSGGIALAQMLGIKAQTKPAKEAFTPIQETIQNSEIMKFAYRDRAIYLGDPDFVEIPTEELLYKHYLGDLAKSVDNTMTSQFGNILDLGEDELFQDKRHTTHFSILDGYGNRVSVTLSINLPFGSGYTSPSTGILLNNEMDDFSIKPGHPNSYGLVGSEANAIAPEKRPLSSMTPTIVESPDKLLITGTPGGSRIISMVYQSILNFEKELSAEEIVSTPRYHHQYKPDLIQHEPDSFSTEDLDYLHSAGYKTKDVGRQYGDMQIVIENKSEDSLSAASDPRGIGQAIVRQ